MKRRKGRAALVASAVVVALACLLALAGCEGDTPAPVMTGVSLSGTPVVVDGYMDLTTLSVEVGGENMSGITLKYTTSPERFAFTVDDQPAVVEDSKITVGFGEHTIGLTYTETFGSAATSFPVDSLLSIPTMESAEGSSEKEWTVTVSHAEVYGADGLSMKMFYTMGDSTEEKVYTNPLRVTYQSEPVAVTVRAALVDGSGNEVVTSAVSEPLSLAPKLIAPTLSAQKIGDGSVWRVDIAYSGSEDPTLEYQVVSNTSAVPAEPDDSRWVLLESFVSSVSVKDNKSQWGQSLYVRATKEGYPVSDAECTTLFHQLDVRADAIVTTSEKNPFYGWKVTFVGEGDGITEGAKISYKYGESYGSAVPAESVYSEGGADVLIPYNRVKAGSMKLWFDVEKDGYDSCATAVDGGIALPVLATSGVTMTVYKENAPYEWEMVLDAEQPGILKYRYTKGKEGATWTAYGKKFFIGRDTVGDVKIESVVVDAVTGEVLSYAEQEFTKAPQPLISVYNTGTTTRYAGGMPDIVFAKDTKKAYPATSQFQWRSSMDDGETWTDWSNATNYSNAGTRMSWKRSNVVKYQARTVLSDSSLLPSDIAESVCEPLYALGSTGPGGGMVVMNKDRGKYVQELGNDPGVVNGFAVNQKEIVEEWRKYDVNSLVRTFDLNQNEIENGWVMKLGKANSYVGLRQSKPGTGATSATMVVGAGNLGDAFYWSDGNISHPFGSGNSYSYQF